MENIMQSDRGFVSGFIGVGIHMRIQHILQHIHIASRYKEELGNLKGLVMRIELIIMHIQQNHLAFKTTSKDKDTASAVNKWLTKLDGDLLLKSSKMVQQCSIPKSRVNVSSCQTEKEINCLIKDITEHLKLSPLLVRIPEHRAGDTQKVIEGLGQIRDSVETLASCATTYQAAFSPKGIARKNLIEETLIVGQEKALANLKELVIGGVQKIGVHGKAGSGKTQLLRQVFYNPEVRNYLSDGLLLWLTVSKIQSPSSVINQLCTGVAFQTMVELDINMNSEQKKQWLRDKIMEREKIALFLDDLCAVESLDGVSTELKLVTELVTARSNGKVIVSSRDPNTLSDMGVEENYKIQIEDLRDEESWKLFVHHAFPNGNLPSKIESEKAKFMCKGLPLAIKVVGRAMAGSTHPQQWEWVLQMLGQAEILNDFLRLGFDAVGNEDINMQLCFLHVAAAFLEDEIIDAQEVIPLWMGEGLLAMQMLQNGPADRCFIEPMIINTEGRPVCLRMKDPFEVGRLYVDNLAEHCLIEPVERDADGRVLCFRMLKVVRDLATQIADHEENFYSHVDEGLTALPNPEPPARKQIFLSRNKFSSLPQFLSSSEIQSLSISQNTQLKKIPRKVIGGLMSLKVLDLSGTSARSLPENVGCLKQLICLKLSGMPIKKLPKSLRDLGHLEILDLSFTKIKGLPSDIQMLRSLRYLGLRGCKNLLNLPHEIWGLISLQYLYMNGCSKWPKPASTRHKKVDSLQSLGDLIQLKQLALENNVEEKFTKGTLGSMTEMDTLVLILPNLKSVPEDIEKMSKLKRLSFKCSTLKEMDSFRCFELTETEAERKMQNVVTKFKHLSYLQFYECLELEQLQYLQELQNLRRLEIILCPKVEEIPNFGEEKGFPSLKIFSLVGLQGLKKLPDVKEGAMRYLQRFNIMGCPQLKMLPEGFLNPKIKTRVYGCSLDVGNGNVEVVTMSKSTEKVIEEYLQIHDWVCSEFWCNGLFQFVKDSGMIFP